MVNTDQEQFEKLLIRAVDGSRTFYERVRDTLCVTDLNADIDDFGVPAHNDLYRSIADYYLIRSDKDATNIPGHVLKSMMQSRAAAGSPNIGLDEVDDVIPYMLEIQALPFEDALAVATGGYEYWLKKRRLKRMFNASTSMEDWDPDTLITNAQQAQAQISRATQQQTKFEFGAGIKKGKIIVERYSSGISKLDAVLGGGWGRKEYCLWIAGSGGGKTVMACQQAVTLANQGLLGVYISTEQPHEELEPRIISAQANIPFERVKDGIDWDKLTAEEAVRVRAVMENLAGKLFFEDWMNDRSKTVVADLDNLVHEYKKIHGRCDFLILDWLGGALGEGITATDQMRLVINQTDDKMSDLAREHDMITHAYAQAHPIQSKNKERVDRTMVTDCKTVGRNATYILGISSMEDLENVNDTATYKLEQKIHCSKARKSVPAPIRVRRDFGFQRFKDWWT